MGHLGLRVFILPANIEAMPAKVISYALQLK